MPECIYDVVERTLSATNMSLDEICMLAYGGMQDDARAAKRRYLDSFEITQTLESYCQHRLSREKESALRLHHTG